MAERFDEILDECVSRIVLQGESVDDCLRLYPDLAAELESELRVVAVAHDTYAPRPGAKDRARAALFAAMASADVIETPVATRTNGHRNSWLPWSNGHRTGLEQVLDECVTAIVLRRESVQDCLDRHPAYAAQLAPHLWIVERFQQAYTFTPNIEAKVRARAALHQAMNDVAQGPSPKWAWLSSFFSPTPMRWAGSLAAVALAAVVTAGGTAYASQDALPGDPLYAVKAAVEGLQVSLAPTEEAKAAVLVHLTERRVEEIQKAAELGRPEAVTQATERLEQQATRAGENLDQATAKGKDVAPLNAALTQQLDQAKQAAEAALPAAPPDMKRALAKAADTADKKKEERKNRPLRPQDQNRGGNNSGSSNPWSAGVPPAGTGAGAVIPPASTPRPPERPEPQSVSPTGRPAEPPRNEAAEREVRPQPGQTRIVEGIIRGITTGQITVNNQTIVVPLGVRIEGGTLAVGAAVRVEGTLQPDGRVLATNIRITRRERRDDDQDEPDERRSPPPPADQNQRPVGRDETSSSASAAEREQREQERERIERQRQEQRIRAERERAAQLELDRLERERDEREEQEREEAREREREQEQIELEREEQRIRAEREKEREGRQRAEQQRLEKERQERQRAEQARLEKERQERQRAEQERLEKERQRAERQRTATPTPAATKTPTPRPTGVADRERPPEKSNGPPVRR